MFEINALKPKKGNGPDLAPGLGKQAFLKENIEFWRAPKKLEILGCGFEVMSEALGWHSVFWKLFGEHLRAAQRVLEKVF